MAELVKKYIVMIVDDEAMVARSISRFFRGDNFESVIVDNPEEVIERAKTMQPDIIIMDVQMPGKNGLKLLMEFRQFDKKTPVIMVSGNMDKDKAEILKRTGANECFEKPLLPSVVVSKVKELLKS